MNRNQINSDNRDSNTQINKVFQPPCRCKFKSLTLVLSFVLLFLGFGGSLKAQTVIFDDTTSPYSLNPTTINIAGIAGQQFFITGTNTVVTKIELPLTKDGSGGNYTVSIYKSTTPTVETGLADMGQLVATVKTDANSTLGVNPAVLTVINTSVPLTSGNYYWLVVSCDSDQPNSLSWYYANITDVNNITGTGRTIRNFYTDPTQAGSYYTEYPFAMKIWAEPVPTPAITSATYNATSGQMVLTCTNLTTGDNIDCTKLKIKGEGGAVVTLSTASVTASSSTNVTINLNVTDKAAVNQILNKALTTSTGGTTYNVEALDDWDANVIAGDISDATNALTVSNIPVPTITNVTYNVSTGVLVVTGTGFLKLAGATNDIDVTKFKFTGDGTDYTLTAATSKVEITNGTRFIVTIAGADKTAVDLRLNKNGTQSIGNVTYNLNAMEDWAAGADAAVNVVSTTNGIKVGIPTITSFSPTSGAIGTTVTITGTNFDPTPANNTVWFGAVKATVGTSTSTQLTVTVPSQAGSVVPIVVEVGGKVAYSVNSTTPVFNITTSPTLALN